MMNIWNMLFPVKCPICGRILRRGEEGACGVCRKELPYVTGPCCMRCGKPVASAEQEYCFDCAKKRDSSLTRGTAVWLYTDAMKKAVADFKYGGCESDGAYYAEEMIRRCGGQLRQWNPEFIVPVPVHRRKKWFRGFDQAECLAEELGKRARIKVLPDALVRERYTRPQNGLDDRQRRRNVREAFSVNHGYDGELSRCRSVLLVDDIYTTGATLEACGEKLREKGVQNVYFVCLCIGRDY